MSLMQNSQYTLGKDNNYLIGGNLCNAFILGELGSERDFFLVGAEPEGESNYPLLTGNFLDANGDILFRLVRNVLVVNPVGCSKILSDRVGYEIHDHDDNMVLRVRTSFERRSVKTPNEAFIEAMQRGENLENIPHTKDFDDDFYITRIEGNFYDREGNLIVSASEDEGLTFQGIKVAIGCNGNAFDFVRGFSVEERTLASIVLSTRGSINQLLTGKHENEEIHLDGKAVLNAEITNCKIHISKGNFILKSSTLTKNQIHLTNEASNIYSLIKDSQ